MPMSITDVHNGKITMVLAETVNSAIKLTNNFQTSAV
jgi:hypothetical protein